ncbi:hypothetical protein Tco_1429805 [Tanacetum coccineum]
MRSHAWMMPKRYGQGIKTRFGGKLREGNDRFPKTLSQLDAPGLVLSQTEDATHNFEAEAKSVLERCMLAFDKRKVDLFNCHNTGHFARSVKFKGSKEINWKSSLQIEELNTCFSMAFTVNNEMKRVLKNIERKGMKAVKDKDVLQKIVDSWFASSKNLWKLVDCGMSSTVKIGLGYGIKSNAEVLGYEEEISRGIFAFRETNAGYNDIPLYSRFKQVEYKGVPPSDLCEERAAPDVDAK